jgi:hypothetical protein
MNGARADDSVNTIRSDRNIKKIKIGVSHHLFDVFRKYQNSPRIFRRSLVGPKMLMFEI